MALWGTKDKEPVMPESLKSVSDGSQDMAPEEKMAVVKEFLEANYKHRLYEHPTEKENPFEVLVACILSQRTRDENTDAALEQLLPVARTPEDILALPEDELKELIYPSGFYNQKAKMIRQACRDVLNDFDGEVPDTREELLEIHGIGPKCADIVLMYGHGIPSIAIDVHCERIPKRIGLVDEDASLADVKAFLESQVPRDEWYYINTSFVKFGREVCKPRHPVCGECPLNRLCDYYRDTYSKENE